MHNAKKPSPSVLAKLIISAGLGLAGFALNSLPIEIFPGIHLVFGGTLVLLSAIALGPTAGGITGSIAGLRTWWLWNQSFPVGALLYGLEGIWVGYALKKRAPSVLSASLLYWILLGGWLNLLAQLMFGLPSRLAFIVQARSVVNGLLAAIAVETGIVLYQLIRRRRFPHTDQPPQLSLKSLITMALMAGIALPLLYISTRAVTDARQRMLNDVTTTATWNVSAVENEVGILLGSYERGLTLASSMIGPAPARQEPETLARLLSQIQQTYPEFHSIYVADKSARTIAFYPSVNPAGERLIGLDFSDRQYYRDLLGARTVISGVFQARGGLSGPAVTIGKSLLDDSENFAGFVVGGFELESFQRLVSRYRGEGEELIITDSEGRLIADSSLGYGEYNLVTSYGDRPEYGLFKNKESGTLHHEEAGAGLESAAQSAIGKSSVISFSTLPATGWKVWTKQSLRPLKASLDKFYLEQLGILLTALLLAVLLSRAAARLVTGPLIQLQRSAAALASGDWSETLEVKPQVAAEFDTLFTSFRRTAESLESSWGRQKQLLREASIAKGELEATFDAMTDAVVITDANDRLIRANRAYYQMTGTDPDSTVGREFTELAHEGEDWTKCDTCAARREGRHAIEVSKLEDASTGAYIEIRVDPILNADGERLGAVQVIRDLTEIRRAEEEAERAGDLLRNLVEAAYDAVYVTDLDGKFLWANRRAADMLALDRDSLEGQAFLHAIHPEDVELVQSAFQRAAAGEAQRYEARYLTAEQKVRHVLVTKSPVYAMNSVAAVLAVMRDVSEERLATEQAMRSDKLRALGQLASGVAHNFNNSLTAVIGYTQMALNKITDQRVTRHLKTVETAALDAAKMVQRIQNFARQRQDQDFAAADLNLVVRDALDLTRSRWRDDARVAGVEYDIIFRPAEQTEIMCDESALREVFVNMIINALDAMPAGGRLTITTAVEDKQASVCFSDTGCGMPEEVRQRIFEPFFTTKGAKGYGMGLAVSYATVQRHNGQVSVQSRPGDGSIFTIALSVGDNVSKTALVEAGPNARQASILIVDDEAPIRTLLSDLLRARGHKVLTAEDGLAGLRAIENYRFDMVITDLSMPGADGWSVVNDVHRRWPGTRLVIITGYGGFADLDVEIGRSNLFDALISKPFNLAEIDSTINDLLLGEGVS